MNPSDVIGLLSGGLGIVGIVILALFITGKIIPASRMEERVSELKIERDEWKRTAELERQRADAGIAAAQIVAQALQPHLRREIEYRENT